VIRLAVRVRGAHAERVLAELLELAPAGVEEVAAEGGTVEYAVYGAPGELPQLPDVHALAGDALVEISTREIADDWHERWRQFHQPVLVAPSERDRAGGRRVPALRIRPPWEPPASEPADELCEIVVDPGQAFGTGGHASTRLCLALLLALAAREPARGPVLDVGTGSGVLAIAAAKLGFTPVLALDHERESVLAARENAAANGADVEVHRLDLRTQELPSPAAAGEDQPARVAVERTVVLANLLRPLLLDLAARLAYPPAHVIASGLLTGEVDDVARAFASGLGLRERERRERGEWAAVWLAREE
jgi:ribosomal protein L11 methyltransferase